MKLKTGDPIIIRWMDAGGRGTWREPKPFEPPDIRQIGFFLRKTRHGVYTTMGFDDTDPDGLVLKMDFVPHGCIKSIRKLR